MLTTGGDSLLLYTFQWRDIELSFSKSILKDDCLSLLYADIFREAYLFFYFSCDCDTFGSVDNI